mmetsp:Transcript_4116/g.16874  ORF Transcript_4116/g.16874 Transcript_4116/m.16874 type:complete len:417 (-) Transcript_4116:47-1297(-)
MRGSYKCVGAASVPDAVGTNGDIAMARARLPSPAHSEGRRLRASSMASFLARAGRMRSSLESTRCRRNFWSVSRSTPNRSTRTADSSSDDVLRKSVPRSAGSVPRWGASVTGADTRSSRGGSELRFHVRSPGASSSLSPPPAGSGSGNASYILSDASDATRSGSAASKSGPDPAPRPNHRRRSTKPLRFAASSRVNVGDQPGCVPPAFLATALAKASANPAADAGARNPAIAGWSLIAGCAPALAPASVPTSSTCTPAARIAAATSTETPVASINGAPSGTTYFFDPLAEHPTGSNGKPSSLPSARVSDATDASTRHTSARYSSDMPVADIPPSAASFKSSQGTGSFDARPRTLAHAVGKTSGIRSTMASSSIGDTFSARVPARVSSRATIVSSHARSTHLLDARAMSRASSASGT